MSILLFHVLILLSVNLGITFFVI